MNPYRQHPYAPPLADDEFSGEIQRTNHRVALMEFVGLAIVSYVCAFAIGMGLAIATQGAWLP